MQKHTFVSLLAALVLLVVPALAQAAGNASKHAAGEQQVLVLLNQVRQQHGLTPFAPSVQLRSAARFHSDDMLQKGYFDHDSPNQAWDARVRGYLNAPLIGEDLAWGNGSYGTPEQLAVLQEAGLVDAGGAGLVELLRGVAEVIHGPQEPRRHLSVVRSTPESK